MGKKSIEKGKRGEREFSGFLASHGVNARRGRQYKGTPDSPDIISDLDEFHFEVKRVEALRIYDALQKAKEDAGNRTAVVAHRRNNKEWIIIMDANDFMTLVKK